MALAVRLRGALGLGGRGVWRGFPRRPGSSAPAPVPPPRLQHRRHPGITRLGTVRLPDTLRNAALMLLHEHSGGNLEDQARDLTNLLWSRQRPVEEEQLRARARELERRLRGDGDSGGGIPHSGLTRGEDEEQWVRRQVLQELRRSVPRWRPLRYSTQLSLVYLAARLDGGYAAVCRVLHEIRKRRPEFQPQTLLDFGSGTGTVTWAARWAWGPSLREFLCVDPSQDMQRLAGQLLNPEGSEGETKHSRGVYFRSYLPVSPKVGFDLAVSAFSLSELPSAADRRNVVQTLWRKTQHFLVLIENGTRDGHQILMEARRTVLTANEEGPAFVFAPCPHELACPKLEAKTPQPCNFSQGYHPLPLPWNPDVKQELFSYVVLARGGRGDAGGEGRWPRLLLPVIPRTRHVHTRLCCPDGNLRSLVVTARHCGRELYRCARRSSWGDRLPVSPGEEPWGETLPPPPPTAHGAPPPPPTNAAPPPPPTYAAPPPPTAHAAPPPPTADPAPPPPMADPAPPPPTETEGGTCPP